MTAKPYKLYGIILKNSLTFGHLCLLNSIPKHAKSRRLLAVCYPCPTLGKTCIAYSPTWHVIQRAGEEKERHKLAMIIYSPRLAATPGEWPKQTRRGDDSASRVLLGSSFCYSTKHDFIHQQQVAGDDSAERKNKNQLL